MKKILTGLGCLTIASLAFSATTNSQQDSDLLTIIKTMEDAKVFSAQFEPTGTGGFVNDRAKPRDGRLFYIVNSFNDLSTLPGTSMGAPSGLAASWGVAFASLSGKANSNDTDASLSTGLGFGDANKGIGGAVSLGIGSIDPRDGGAFNRGNLNVSFGHNWSKYRLGTSVGINSIDLWRADSNDSSDPSFYFATTKAVDTSWKSMMFTAGFGNNSFADVRKNGDRTHKVDGFASGAVYLHPQLSFIVDYTSRILGAGFGIVPMPQYPLSITLGATDLNKRGPEDKVSFVGTLSYSYTF